jgi:hypothetical protein
LQKSAGKVLASISFWDQDGILLIDYRQKGQRGVFLISACLVAVAFSFLVGLRTYQHPGYVKKCAVVGHSTK